MALPSLTSALKYFERVFDQGRGSLEQDALNLLHMLVLLEVIFAGIYMALGSSTESKAIARKVIIIGFFFWIIQNYQSLLQTVVDGFLYAGNRGAAGTANNLSALRDPDMIFRHGLTLLKPAVDKLFAVWSQSFFGILTPDSIMLLIVIVVSVFSFGLISIHVFITYLEYLLITAAGLILIPFGVFKPTAFVAERVFGAIIAYGIKLMVLALIVSVTEQFLGTISLPATVTWQEAFEFVIISLALAMLSFHAPSAALGLLSASPQLSIGAVTSTAAAGAAAAGGVGAVASAGMGAAAGAARITSTAAGAMKGGFDGAMSKEKALQQKASESGTKRSKALTALKVGTGMVTGPAMAMASNAVERLAYGKEGSATGKRQTLMASGHSYTQGGAVGAFQRGQFGVPSFRKSQRSGKDSTPSSKNDKGEDK